MPNLMIIVASTRPGRAGLPIARWVDGAARASGRFANIDFADLAEIDLPFLDEPHHPRLQQYTHAHTRSWAARVEAADAVLIVTPEYNYGLPAPLKNALDYLSLEWGYKPVAFVSYGGLSGGTRAVQMARQVTSALRMLPLGETLAIPFFSQFISEGVFHPAESHTAALQPLFAELARTAGLMRGVRARDGAVA